jgi:hypothetical protein
VSEITKNDLLLWSVVAFLGYWLVGWVAWDPAPSAAVSLFLLIAGSVTFARYGPKAFDVVWRKRRLSDAQDGSHWAVYGVGLLSAGAVYQGLFGLAWLAWGQPTDWLGTPVSAFGRYLMAWGFALLFFSPDVGKRGLRPSSRTWLMIGGAAIIAGIAFAAGWYLGPKNAGAASNMHYSLAGRAQCPSDRPVWGSHRRVYHDAQSKYRHMVIPARCFRSTREAEGAGYRAPG